MHNESINREVLKQMQTVGKKAGLAGMEIIKGVVLADEEWTTVNVSSVLFLCNLKQKIKQKQKHTTVGIRWWSPTQLLIHRSEACVWQSGRDAQFSSVYGRMCQAFLKVNIYW